jgi:hypothetical protein
MGTRLILRLSAARLRRRGGSLQQAIELAKKGENGHGTLALAEYRSGHRAESLAASERSMKQRGSGQISFPVNIRNERRSFSAS